MRFTYAQMNKPLTNAQIRVGLVLVRSGGWRFPSPRAVEQACLDAWGRGLTSFLGAERRCELMRRCLRKPPGVRRQSQSNGWPYRPPLT